MSNEPLHVAVGVIKNDAGQYLVSHRHEHLHQGGLWEFPGGKVEAGENVQMALARELREELSIQVEQVSPLIRIPFEYPDRSVLLDVWQLESYFGDPRGLEDQGIRWVDETDLLELDFPAANRPILNALRLTHELLITGEFTEEKQFLIQLEACLRNGVRLVQLRAKHLNHADYIRLAEHALPLIQEYGGELIANAPLSVFEKSKAHGFHLNSEALLKCDARPVDRQYWLSASVHNNEELDKAALVGVDFAVLSPVYKTSSHPDTPPIGLDEFARLTDRAPFPVFALGGMTRADVNTVRRNGGQGIAAIRAFWQVN